MRLNLAKLSLSPKILFWQQIPQIAQERDFNALEREQIQCELKKNYDKG